MTTVRLSLCEKSEHFFEISSDSPGFITKEVKGNFRYTFWNGQTASWMIPMPYLSKASVVFPSAEWKENLLDYIKRYRDNLAYLRSIQESTQEKLKEKISTKEIEPKYDSKLPLFPHQVVAVDLIRRFKEFALFDEQGLGKTGTMVVALSSLIDDDEIDCVLVSCPASLKKTWENEIHQFTEKTSTILGGSTRIRRRKQWELDSHFYIINYESLLRDRKLALDLVDNKRVALVLDESHKIKNPEGKTTVGLIAVASKAKRRYIMTGTLIANRPQDAWSQFKILDGGKLLGYSYMEDFIPEYTYFGSDARFGNTVIFGYKRQDELRDRISRASIRRLKNNVLDLPEKIYKTVNVQLGKKQLDLYMNIIGVIEGEFEQELQMGLPPPSEDSILNKIIRLIQIASNPNLITSVEFDDVPAKIEALDELVEEILEQEGNKIVIWSTFVDNLKLVAERYKKYGTRLVHGDVPLDKRDEAVKAIQNDPNVRIFVANPACAGTGYTLTAASTAIYLDRNYNLIDYIQSQDRIHRIGQKSNCSIIHLIADGTIDEHIDHILKTKQDVASFLQKDGVKKIKNVIRGKLFIPEP